MKTPDEIKKGLECCKDYQSCTEYGEPKCPYNDIKECVDTLLADALAHSQQFEKRVIHLEALNQSNLATITMQERTRARMQGQISQLEAERDELKEALGLMVYQYCVRGDKLDHLYMCAGETAFRVLGLEQYGNTSSLESWLFPEYQGEEE